MTDAVAYDLFEVAPSYSYTTYFETVTVYCAVEGCGWSHVFESESTLLPAIMIEASRHIHERREAT